VRGVPVHDAARGFDSAPDAYERGEREVLLAEVRALLATHPDTAGRAEVGLAYATDLHVYERT
jgi:hypothetical protein